MSADIIEFVCSIVWNWCLRYRGGDFIDFYDGSYQADVKFTFW